MDVTAIILPINKWPSHNAVAAVAKFGLSVIYFIRNYFATSKIG